MGSSTVHSAIDPRIAIAGVMVLSKEHPREILYRSVKPELTPELPEQHNKIAPNVVFPLAIIRKEQYDDERI